MALSRTAGLALGLAVLGVAGLVLYETTQKGPRPGLSPVPPGGPGPGPTPFVPPTGGCVPITLVAQGAGSVSGCGGSTRSSTQVCPAPGEQCVFTAWPDPGAVFLEWSGPGGVTSKANPIALPATAAGFVQGIFTGIQPGPGPGPTPPGLPPCPRAAGTAISNGQANSKVYVVDHLGRKHWITNGAAWLWCAYGGKQTTVCNVDAVPTGSDIGFGASCCPGEGNPPPGCSVY